MSITMRDVAQEAGVSIKTVSRVVNEQGEIRDETRDRVLDAIKRLGYRPSKVARALVTSRTETIGLLIGDISNPYFSEVARGVLDTAQEQEYNVFLCNTDFPETEKRAVYSLIDHNIDGAIIYPTWDNWKWLREIANPDLPFVLVNAEVEPKPGFSVIQTEIRKGAQLAIDYLYSKGHRKIGMIAGEVAPLEKINRVQGYRDALLAHGLPFDADLVVLGLPVIDHGVIASKKLLLEHPDISAIFCYNDLIAFGAIQGCTEIGKRIPEDCAIVGYDNVQLSAFIHPRLTTVHVDKYEIGKRSTSLLLQMLKNPDKEYPVQYVNTDLIVRDSA